MNVNILGDWVDRLQASGHYSFLRQEAIDASGTSAEAVKKSLQRLAKRKRIHFFPTIFSRFVDTNMVGLSADGPLTPLSPCGR